jgi:outer membrane lipoprotein-sorting protein
VISRTLVLIAFLLWGGGAQALTDAERDAIRSAEAYLEGIETLEADFIQQVQNGGVAEGRLLMRRPGQLRFEYAPPNRILLVANGFLVSFVDYEIGQLSQWPLSDTPLSYLVREKVDLLSETLIDQVEMQGGALRFRLRDRDDPDQGAIMFSFSTEPMALRGWRLTDAQEQQTAVALTNLRTNVQLPDDAFDFDEPQAPWETDR